MIVSRVIQTKVDGVPSLTVDPSAVCLSNKAAGFAVSVAEIVGDATSGHEAGMSTSRSLFVDRVAVSGD